MELFLQIFGALVLVVVILAVAAYFHFRKQIRQLMEMGGEDHTVPLLIHLNVDPMPEWLEEPSIEARLLEIEALGFERRSAYVIPELQAMELQAFAKAPCLACLGHHTVAGTWFEMIAEDEEGRIYSVSNVNMGGEIDTDPNNVKIILNPSASPEQIDRAMAEAIRDAACVDLSRRDFREQYEQGYKKEMGWKMGQGGITYEEVRKVAENSGEAYDDETLEEAFLEAKENELQQWHDAAIHEFLAAQDIDEAQFYEQEERHLIVPSKGDPVTFIRYLGNCGFINDEHVERYEQAYGSEQEIPALFANINDSLSPSLRAEAKGTVRYPLDITIYKMHNLEY